MEKINWELQLGQNSTQVAHFNTGRCA